VRANSYLIRIATADDDYELMPMRAMFYNTHMRLYLGPRTDYSALRSHNWPSGRRRRIIKPQKGNVTATDSYWHPKRPVSFLDGGNSWRDKENVSPTD